MTRDGTAPGADFGLPPPREDEPSGQPELETVPSAAQHRARAGVRVTVLAGVLVVALAVSGVVLESRRGTQQPRSSSALAASSTPTAGPATSSTPLPSARSGTAASGLGGGVPGWTVVQGRERVAFDVPPDWTVEGRDLLAGFETHAPQDAPQLVVMHDVASFRSGVCSNLEASSRGRAGFVVPGRGTPRQVAAELSQTWAEVAALDHGGVSPRVGATATNQVRIAGGTLEATESTTILTITHPEPCQAPAMAFTAISFETLGQVVAFVVYTDEVVADALPQDVARTIITSLRATGP